MGKAVTLTIAMLLAIYGLFCIVWPHKVRGHFLANYGLESPLKWHNPATWLRHKPGLLVFRIVGILILVLAALLMIAAWPGRP